MREILPGVFHWTAKHPRIGIEVSSYWLDDSGVLLDPLVPPDVGLDWFEQRSTAPTAVVLTNRHHYRESGRFAERFGCTVHCVAAGMHEFTHNEVVTPFQFGDLLPGGLLAVEIDAICPDDSALHARAGRWVAFADGFVRGGARDQEDPLGFVPDALMDDPSGTKQGLLASAQRVLDTLDFDHVLLAHGDPLIGNGREALADLVRTGGRTVFTI